MKIVKSTYLILATLIVVISCNKPMNKKIEENKISFIKSNGVELVNDNNESILLKGTNLGHWLVPEGYMFKMDQVNSPYKIDELLHELIGPDSLAVFWDRFLTNYITKEDITYLKKIGCNHIRLPFNYKMFTDDLYMGKRNSGFQYFDKIIEWCKQEELYVLLDMHCAPGGQTGDNIDDSYGYPFLFKSKSSQDLFVKIWMDIVDRYKDEPIILGYDLMNEPIAHYYENELDVLNKELLNIYKRTVKEIRAIDQEHLIFLNGSVWSSNFEVFEELLGENIVYEFHKYWVDVNYDAIGQYVEFRDKHKVPIYVGETGENTDEWVNDFRVLLEEYEINWCFWPYKKMNNTRGIMNFEEPLEYELIKTYAKSDRSSYKNMRENRPDIALVQKALNDYLENCKYEHNFENEGYTTSLGLKVIK